MRRAIPALFLLGLALPDLGCNDATTATTDASADSATAADSADSADSATTADSAASETVASETTPDTAEVTPPAPMPEEEPNNGATLTEYNALALATTATGAIGVAKDVDVFRLDTRPGHVYRAVLTATPASELTPHLTVMDTGRGDASAGEDYVKMAVGGAGPAVVEWLALGEGGHFVIVRDDRNVHGGSVGSAAHTYELVVTELPLADVSGAPLVFPASFQDALPSAGGLRVYAFEGAEGHDLRADLQASGDLDARLLVFARATGSWIARNDDRAADDVDPLLDAPLTASGAMLLVVENVATGATQLGYTLSCQAP